MPGLCLSASCPAVEPSTAADLPAGGRSVTTNITDGFDVPTRERSAALNVALFVDKFRVRLPGRPRPARAVARGHRRMNTKRQQTFHLRTPRLVFRS